MPAPMADRLGGVKPGDKVTLTTSNGLADFTVAAIYATFGGSGGEVTIGVGDAKARFGSDRPEALLIKTAPNVAPQQVANRIDAALGVPANRATSNFGNDKVTIITSSIVKRDAFKQLNGYFSLFFAVLLVAGVVGLLGLANTLAMSVLQRFRAIGTTSRQVVGMVLVEAATMVGVALVLAIPLGGLLSVFAVRNASSSLGFTINYQYPWGWLPIVAIMAAGVGLLAAIAPARRAGRLQVVNALALE